MAGHDSRRARPLRWSALPALLERAPARIVLLVGIAVTVLGLAIVTRPLTSLVVLGLYVGVSAVVTGTIDLVGPGRSHRWWTRAAAIIWIVGGVAVIVWLGRSLDLLPVVLAVLLILGGVASLGDAIVQGRVSERALAAAWGGAQVAFGVLALTWPDITVLVVAVVFGVRTAVFGIVLIVRGARGMRAPKPVEERRVAPRTARIAGDVGRWMLAALLIASAAGGWWLNQFLDDGAPVVDAFYNPPEEVPSEHGELIRSDEYLGRTPRGGEVHRILYTTTDSAGDPAVASGLVIVPVDRPAKPLPVVIWNHGTTGVAQGCAPSLQDATATKWAIPAVDEAVAKGWVVVASDYSGQGAPGVFPYLIGQGEARSSLDAARAARGLGLWLSRDIVVWGHSQGGHAALWTGQIAAEYTPEMTVKGIAALSPVTDPTALAGEMTSGEGNALLSVLISWVLVPYADTYPDVNLDRYVATGARSIVREMTQRCPSEPGVIVSVAAALGVSEDRPLYVGDLTGGALGSRLRQNAVVGPFEGAPLLVGWGRADEVIPPELQQNFVDKMCAQGEDVRWYSYAAMDHRGVLMPGSPFLPLLVYWTDDRFEGRPGPVDDCAV